MKQEIRRKIFHMLILLIPASYHFLGKWQSLVIIAPICTLVFLLDYFRSKNSKLNEFFVKFFNPILREKEKKAEILCGATYLLLATCVCFFFFKKEFVITAFVILAISDALASLVGKSIKSKEFFEKSRAGSIAFFVSALVVMISFAIILDAKLWFYFFGIITVSFVTLIEARPSFVEIDDNFSIPFSFCAFMTFFDIVINYSF